MDGHAEYTTDGEEEEGDDDEDGGVPPHVMLQSVVCRQLQQGPAVEAPGEEALLGGADPRLEERRES